MNQLTEEQAIKIADSEIWKNWTPLQIVAIQLFQERLCLPFHEFHAAMEIVLNHSILTHEFINVETLKDEYEKKENKPTLQEIQSLISVIGINL